MYNCNCVLQVFPGLKYPVTWAKAWTSPGMATPVHESNLKHVLRKLHQYGLRLNKSKCHFFQNEYGELEFLKNAVSHDRVRLTDSRNEAIQEAPAPTDNIKCQVFTKFSSNITLLYQLLRKNIK